MAFTSMRFLSFVFLCQNWVTTLNAEKGIEATNQGYGRLGTSMTLKYNTGKEKWSVCYWYRYEAGESADDAENGMFINANGAVTGLATNTFLVLFSGGGDIYWSGGQILQSGGRKYYNFWSTEREIN